MVTSQKRAAGHVEGCEEPLHAVDANGDTWCIGCDQLLQPAGTDTAPTGADS